jgi:hypothetical protein
MTKPVGMSDDHWFAREAPRVGKSYSKQPERLYGMDSPQPKSGEDERGEGCGGACEI